MREAADKAEAGGWNRSVNEEETIRHAINNICENQNNKKYETRTDQ